MLAFETQVAQATAVPRRGIREDKFAQASCHFKALQAPDAPLALAAAGAGLAPRRVAWALLCGASGLPSGNGAAPRAAACLARTMLMAYRW